VETDTLRLSRDATADHGARLRVPRRCVEGSPTCRHTEIVVAAYGNDESGCSYSGAGASYGVEVTNRLICLENVYLHYDPARCYT